MRADRVRVGDVLSLQRRSVAVDPLGRYEEIGVRSFGRGIFHKEPVSGASLGDKRVFRIEPGDLVLSNVFAWEGAVALASEAEAGRIGSHRFMTFVPSGSRLDVAWASWFFRSEPGLELIRKASPGSAGRNRTLAIERFEALAIPLPPIEEQRRVAARLDLIAEHQHMLASLRGRAGQLAGATPASMRIQLEKNVSLTETKLGDVLELVRRPVEITPTDSYVTIGMRSFGKGIFHYPARPGAAIGKLRFHEVEPGLLALSNIKAWEGAVATTTDRQLGTVASNRFLFFRPVAGEEAAEYFRELLLVGEGLAALGQASPGSADRNRTLAVDRFRRISLPIPGAEDQIRIGRRLCAVRALATRLATLSHESDNRVSALVPAAMNEAFGGIN